MASASTSENVTVIKAAVTHARGQSADVVDGYGAGGLRAGRRLRATASAANPTGASRHHAHSNNIDLEDEV